MLDHSQPMFARRMSAKRMKVAETMELYREQTLKKATTEQANVCRYFCEGGEASNHAAVSEVHSYECSMDGGDVVAHRTYRFQDTGRPAFDFRTQLIRIAPDGSTRVI